MIVQTVVANQTDINNIITLAAMKSFMRITASNDDTLIEDLIKSSITEVNEITRLNIANATFEQYYSSFKDELSLKKNPVKSILKVETLLDDGSYSIVPSSTYYLYEDNKVAKVIFKESFTAMNHKKAIKITFTSGYLIVPADIVSWIKVRVSTLYEHREEIALGVSIANLTHVNNILNKYKIWTV